jgi:hypothetical protein
VLLALQGIVNQPGRMNKISAGHARLRIKNDALAAIVINKTAIEACSRNRASLPSSTFKASVW